MTERKKWRIAEYALIGWPADSACRVGVDPMPQHLPECLVPDFETGRWVCICKHLRACEERVHEAAYQAGKSYGLTVNGYTRGLDAARSAVEKMDLHGCLPRGPLNCNCVGPKVIAAIDALRKESQ